MLSFLSHKLDVPFANVEVHPRGKLNETPITAIVLASKGIGVFGGSKLILAKIAYTIVEINESIK